MKTHHESFEPIERHEIVQRAPLAPVEVKTRFRFEIESDRILSLAEIERAYLSQVTRDTNLSKERLSEILGINRKTLYRKQKEYSL